MINPHKVNKNTSLTKSVHSQLIRCNVGTSVGQAENVIKSDISVSLAALTARHI